MAAYLGQELRFVLSPLSLSIDSGLESKWLKIMGNLQINIVTLGYSGPFCWAAWLSRSVSHLGLFKEVAQRGVVS